MNQVPVAIGLFLCEKVIVEEGTHNITLVNTFNKRVVDEIPWTPTDFILYALLTDGLGEGDLNVAIYRLDDMEEIHEQSTKFRFKNPLHELRCWVTIRNCTFPEEGHYQAALFFAGQQIAQRRFLIQKQESQP